MSARSPFKRIQRFLQVQQTQPYFLIDPAVAHIEFSVAVSRR